jgi:bacillithiol synthase
MTHRLIYRPDSLLPKLVCDYLHNRPELSEFHSGLPSLEALIEFASDREPGMESRQRLADTLERQYAGSTLHPEVARNIQALRKTGTFTVTTGHQLCLATGPLFVIYKIMSVIRLAQILQETGALVGVVPVLWLATEDHDFEEVNHLFVGDERIEWSHPSGNAVGRLDNKALDAVLQSIMSIWPESGKREEVESILRDAFTEPVYRDVFRKLIRDLFSEYGLVMIDGDDSELKRSFSSILRKEVAGGVAFDQVSLTNERLRQMGYQPQVNPRDINLFYLADDLRRRITRDGEAGYKVVDSDISFTQDQMNSALNDSPELFSPNVVLRPVYQEFILPNLAYVGGAGELNYWLQLKSLFQNLAVPFPLLVLRDSALLISERNAKRMKKLGLFPEDVFKNREGLIRSIADDSGLTDLSEEKEKLSALFGPLIEKARKVDATLEGAARAELQKQLSAMDQFSKRMLKAAKLKEEDSIRQLDKLLGEIMPSGSLQERHDNYFDHVLRTGQWFHHDVLPFFNPLAGGIHVFEF